MVEPINIGKTYVAGNVTDIRTRKFLYVLQVANFIFNIYIVYAIRNEKTFLMGSMRLLRVCTCISKCGRGRN